MELCAACSAGDVGKVEEALQTCDVNSRDENGRTALVCAIEKNCLPVVSLLLSRGARPNLCTKDGWSPLHHCVSKDRGFKDCLVALIESGADVNIENTDGNTPLNLCAMNNLDDCGKVLLRHGAKVNHVNRAQWSALMQACSKDRGYVQVVRTLVASGADVNLRKEDGDTALGLCCTNGFTECARILVENGADVNTQKFSNSWSPLMHCCAKGRGYEDLVKLLLENGAQVDMLNIEENSALAVCCMNGFSNVAQLLLEKGADVNRQSKGGWGMLHQTVCKGRGTKGHLQVAEVLLKHGIDVNMKNSELNTALNLAAMNGYHEIAALLVEKGADVNNQAADGWTALHCCVGANRGFKEIASLLVSNGADVNVRNAQGVAPLALCAMNNFKDIAEMLLQAGAKPNNQSETGWTALMEAISVNRGFKNIVELLLASGADVNLKTSDGITALHLACLYAHEEIASLLVASNAELSPRDKDGWTPLHCVCSEQHGQEALARILLEKGCDVNVEDDFGYTPLHFCVTWAVPENLVSLLVKSGADVNKPVKCGMTPLLLAAECGNLNIMVQLVQLGAKLDPPSFQHDLRTHCPQGHELIAFQADEESALCSLCAKKLVPNIALCSCRLCDYDVCLPCSEKDEPVHAVFSPHQVAKSEKHAKIETFLTSLLRERAESETAQASSSDLSERSDSDSDTRPRQAGQLEQSSQSVQQTTQPVQPTSQPLQQSTQETAQTTQQQESSQEEERQGEVSSRVSIVSSEASSTTEPSAKSGEKRGTAKFFRCVAPKLHRPKLFNKKKNDK